MTAMTLATERNFLCNYGPFPYFLFKQTPVPWCVWILFWFAFVVWGFEFYKDRISISKWHIDNTKLYISKTDVLAQSMKYVSNYILIKLH